MKPLLKRAVMVYGIVALLALWHVVDPKPSPSLKIRSPASLISLSDSN